MTHQSHGGPGADRQRRGRAVWNNAGMKLTDEALDYPDCMVPRANNSIKTPAWLQKMLDEAAERAERERVSTVLRPFRPAAKARKGEADDAAG